MFNEQVINNPTETPLLDGWTGHCSLRWDMEVGICMFIVGDEAAGSPGTMVAEIKYAVRYHFGMFGLDLVQVWFSVVS